MAQIRVIGLPDEVASLLEQLHAVVPGLRERRRYGAEQPGEIRVYLEAPAPVVPDPQVKALAAEALRAVMGGDWGKVGAAVERLNVIDGALCDAMQMWCDTLVVHLCAGVPRPGNAVSLHFQSVDTGAVCGSDAPQVPTPVVWAGRLIAARMAMDEDGFMALLSVPQDPDAVADHVEALLMAVASTIQHSPRGAALTGRSG